MDRRVWQAIVHRITESDTTERLTHTHTHTHTYYHNTVGGSEEHLHTSWWDLPSKPSWVNKMLAAEPRPWAWVRKMLLWRSWPSPGETPNMSTSGSSQEHNQLEKWFPKCGLQTGRSGATWEPAKNANCCTLLQTYRIRTTGVGPWDLWILWEALQVFTKIEKYCFCWR